MGKLACTDMWISDGQRTANGNAVSGMIRPEGSHMDGQACLHRHVDIRRATDSERQRRERCDTPEGSHKGGKLACRLVFQRFLYLTHSSLHCSAVPKNSNAGHVLGQLPKSSNTWMSDAFWATSLA